VKLPHLFTFQIMENIGDKDAAIAERVRALLAAANSSSATGSAALPPSVGAVPVPPTAAVPAGVRRLESATDPATVVANLTVAGIRYAVSYFGHFSARWLDGCIIEDGSDPNCGSAIF
jgi:hypothetical protein